MTSQTMEKNLDISGYEWVLDNELKSLGLYSQYRGFQGFDYLGDIVQHSILQDVRKKILGFIPFKKSEVIAEIISEPSFQKDVDVRKLDYYDRLLYKGLKIKVVNQQFEASLKEIGKRLEARLGEIVDIS